MQFFHHDGFDLAFIIGPRLDRQRKPAGGADQPGRGFRPLPVEVHGDDGGAGQRIGKSRRLAVTQYVAG